jgi:general secretion pathway protein L
MSRDFALWHTEDSAPPPPGRHVAVLPGQMVALHRVDLPERIRGPARLRVARSMFAPGLAGSPETLDIVPLVPRAGAAPWSVLQVVGREALAAVTPRLASGCLSLVPDYLTLPHGAGLWVLALRGAGDDMRLLVRAGADRGFAAEPDLAGAILSRWLAKDPPKAVLFQAPADGAPLPEAVAGMFGAAGLAIAPLGDATPGLEWPGAEDLRRLDLRGRPTGSDNRILRALVRVRAPLVAAGLAGLVMLGALMFETRQMNAAARADRAQVATLVQSHLLPGAPILDLRAQVRREIEARQQRRAGDTAQGGPLEVLRALSLALVAGGVTADTVQYAPQGGLVVQLRGPGFEALDALMAALDEAGLAARLVEARAAETGVVAQVAVATGAP